MTAVLRRGSAGRDLASVTCSRPVPGRWHPLDRTRELGGASVPVRCDAHAMAVSDDALSLRTRLHREFADRQVNLISLRREFFRVTPAEMGDVLTRQQALVTGRAGEPEALEWRQSQTARRQEALSTATCQAGIASAIT